MLRQHARCSSWHCTAVGGREAAATRQAGGHRTGTLGRHGRAAPPDARLAAHQRAARACAPPTFLAHHPAGFFFGRTPLIKLSPKKTWEGFLGGCVGTGEATAGRTPCRTRRARAG